MKQVIVLCRKGDERESYTETDFAAAQALFHRALANPGVLGFKTTADGKSVRTDAFDPAADEHRVIGALQGG